MSKSRRKPPANQAVEEIEAGLRSLTSGLRRLVRDVNRGNGNGRARRRRPVTAALRLQGRYMGLIRTLPPRQKGRVKAIRVKKGVLEAIRLARALKA